MSTFTKRQDFLTFRAGIVRGRGSGRQIVEVWDDWGRPGRAGDEVVLEASAGRVTGGTRNYPVVAQKGCHYAEAMVRGESDWM